MASMPANSKLDLAISAQELKVVVADFIDYDHLSLNNVDWEVLVKFYTIFASPDAAPDVLDDAVLFRALRHVRGKVDGMKNIYALIYLLKIDGNGLSVSQKFQEAIAVFATSTVANSEGKRYTRENFLADLQCDNKGRFVKHNSKGFVMLDKSRDALFNIGTANVLDVVFGDSLDDIDTASDDTSSSELSDSSMDGTEDRERGSSVAIKEEEKEPRWGLNSAAKEKPVARGRDEKSPSPAKFPLKSKRGITNLDDVEDGGDPAGSEYLGYFSSNRRRIPCYGFGHGDFYQLIAPHGVASPDENIHEDLRSTSENADPDVKLGEPGIQIRRICGVFAHVPARPSCRVVIYCNIAITKLGPDSQMDDSIWSTYSEILSAHQYVKDNTLATGYKKKGKIGKKATIQMIRTFIAARKKKMQAQGLEDVEIPEQFRGEQPNSPNDIEIYLRHKEDTALAKAFEKERKYPGAESEETAVRHSERLSNLVQAPTPQTSRNGTTTDITNVPQSQSENHLLNELSARMKKLEDSQAQMQESLNAKLTEALIKFLNDPKGVFATTLAQLGTKQT